MVFVLQGTALGRLECGYSHRRHFNSLVALLRAIGAYCFDSGNDGVFHVGVLRLLPLVSHLRTLMYAHLPALVACGAIEACGEDMYRFVGFHEHNLSAKRLNERKQQAQEDWAAAKRQQRRLRACRDSMKAQPQEMAGLANNSAVHEKCPAQPTKATAPLADFQSATNASACPQKAAEVDSPREKPDRRGDHGPLKPSLAAMFEQAMADARNGNVIPELPEEEIAAVEQELLGAAPKAPSRASRSVPHAHFPVRLARKPKQRTDLTEPAIEASLRALQVRLSPEATDAWWTDMRALGVSAEDLEYAVWSVRYQQEKKKRSIHQPLAYAQKILRSQACARTGAMP